MTAGAALRILGLIGALRSLLVRFNDPKLAAFLADWPKRPRIDRDMQAVSLPVLAWLKGAAEKTVPATASPTRTLVALASELAWRQTYTADDFGAAFLQRYGFAELIGTRGPVASGRLACGFLLLGPDILYPVHRHEAEEIYVTMGGTAEWRTEADRWAPAPPGTLIHHAPWLPHAMRTAGDPMLALYLWRAGDLAQKSLIG